MAEHKFTGKERVEEEPTMFYSQCLLSRKGPLGAIWVAGYCFKRLKKSQVTDTDISSSVEHILVEGLPSVTYRILAYLLLGVVRIYSKKVEYLFQDCHETVCDINRFSVGKKVVPFRDIVRSSFSITLPERYELDAFQLEVGDGTSGGNIAQTEEIIFKDARKDVSVQGPLDKHSSGEVSPHCAENHIGQTSAGVTMEQETCVSTQTPDKLAADRETSTFAHTPPDKVLSPRQMEIDMEISSIDPMKNFERSKERLRELRFSQEECMEIDIELLNLINDYQVQKADDGAGDGSALEKPMLENPDHVILKDKEVPSSIEETRDLEVQGASGGATQELFALSTPAKENIQRPNKRKCIIDETLVMSNEHMKQALKNASDLVCKRRKAPHTVIDLWRFTRVPTLSKNFFEPLVPCAALELQHVHCKKKVERREPSISAAVETLEASGNPEDIISPRTPGGSRSTIAPGTPVRCPTMARVFESPRGCDSDGEGPGSSFGNMRKELPVNEEDHLDLSLMDEMNANEGDSQELNKNKNGLSARTRIVATYLHRVIHEKKQRGERAVTLLPLLERKTRGENARFFFEILVLTCGGFMNVTQERAYDDLLLQETPKMEATVGNC